MIDNKIGEDRQQLFDQHDKHIQELKTTVRQLHEVINKHSQEIVKLKKKVNENWNYINILRG